ncbi:hypothetical protein [Roseateles sp.]|uniref:hypothetical protein n=1 Tax=Roseateles sp. TaxID=1971397 RepID=UPI002E03948B|nr:hypothetical protein [Roseateles sp.]
MTCHSLLRRLAGASCLLAGGAFASPGAHGPNGEHLDGPATAMVGSGLPRIEAHSEAYELVGRLGDDSLVLYVSRYETNEAVLGARLEVEFGALKAPALFQTEGGSYRLTDKALIGALHRPGNHALVFTLSAGADGDLLDGTLNISAPDGHAHASAGPAWGVIAVGVLGALVVVGAAASLVKRRRRRSNSFGGAQ